MTLNLGQWAAIGTIIAVHCPNPALIAAVETELAIARETALPEPETTPKESIMVAQMKTAPAGNRDLTTTHDLEGDAQWL